MPDPAGSSPSSAQLASFCIASDASGVPGPCHSLLIRCCRRCLAVALTLFSICATAPQIKLKTLDLGNNKIPRIENVSHLKVLEEFWVSSSPFLWFLYSCGEVGGWREPIGSCRMVHTSPGSSSALSYPFPSSTSLYMFLFHSRSRKCSSHPGIATSASSG